jgi:hypothetical protein
MALRLGLHAPQPKLVKQQSACPARGLLGHRGIALQIPTLIRLLVQHERFVMRECQVSAVL